MNDLFFFFLNELFAEGSKSRLRSSQKSSKIRINFNREKLPGTSSEAFSPF